VSIQISNLHISTKSKVTGIATVAIESRKDAVSRGQFRVRLNVIFDPSSQDYPSGNVLIDIDLSDSIKGRALSASIDQMNSYGKHTQTIFLTGKCRLKLNPGEPTPTGCRFWMMVAHNKTSGESGTPDIVSFVVFDKTGKRIAYGTGPVVKGDLDVKNDD
jgi:hypothetical protein